MFYDPPAKWTEELVDELPFGEDDRYEWKSGDQISKNKLNEFWNDLAKEIGALANSFGGTLFVGIRDDKTKVGVPAIAKGSTPSERWFENKIPTLFELRLQHFRVGRVNLSENTQNQIGDGKIIIAIDVFDSELAPHQCVFDQRYYYRVNSESRPAPHHYLAFLWGRASSNMSQVATWWLRDFINPLIDLVEHVARSFEHNLFNLRSTEVRAHSSVYEYRIDFFNISDWYDIKFSNVGEYFLTTFPLTKKALTSFDIRTLEFSRAVLGLEKALEESAPLLDEVMSLYERIVAPADISRSEFEGSNLQEMTRLLFRELHLAIFNYPGEAKNNLIRFVAYTFMGLGILFPLNSLPDDQKLISLAEELRDKLGNKDPLVITRVEEARQSFEIMKRESLAFLEQLKAERIALARRYTATFGNG